MSRKGCELCSGEHFTSTLHEPASPISLTRLVNELAIVVKTWEAPERRSGSARGSPPPGAKISTVCVSPSVSGDHHAAERSAIAPTRTGPTRRSGASDPKNTISTSSGTPASSRARRIAPACGELTATCAAKPSCTADHGRSRAAGSGNDASIGRATPITRRFLLRWLAWRTLASSLSVTRDSRKRGASCAARRSFGAATVFSASAGSPGTEGICAATAQAPASAAAARKRTTLAAVFCMLLFRPAPRAGVPL